LLLLLQPCCLLSAAPAPAARQSVASQKPVAGRDAREQKGGRGRTEKALQDHASQVQEASMTPQIAVSSGGLQAVRANKPGLASVAQPGQALAAGLPGSAACLGARLASGLPALAGCLTVCG
jgi:hypothetical protein